MTREYHKEMNYWLRMELQTIAKLERHDAVNAFKILTAAQKPVFSGSVDHRIN